MIREWFELLEIGMKKKFELNGQLMPFYCAMMAINETGRYKVISSETIPEGYKGWDYLVSQNFLHGFPITACSFYSMIITNDHEGKEVEAVFMTFETPLKKSRKIWLIHQTEEGKKHLIEDGFLGTYATLLPEVNQYNYLIASDYNFTQ